MAGSSFLRASAAFLSLLVLSATGAHGDNPEVKRFANVRERMQAFVEEGEISGAVTVIGRKDGIVSIEAVGSTHLGAESPMGRDRLFRIASMTKPITAIAIMILAEEGKLSVEDAVEKHLPEFKGQLLVAEKTLDNLKLKKPSRVITIRDLLTHTSGLPGGMPIGLGDLYVKRNHTLAEAIMAVSQRPLDFEPGSKWAYCNAGIDTLGRIVEVASGMGYEEFLKKRIFDPLEMADTTFYPTEKQLKRLAPTYDRKDGKLVMVSNPLIGSPVGARHPIPAGGLYSTADDLARVCRMMLNKGTLGKVKILSPESVAAMTTNHTGDLQAGFTPGMGWGYGWGVVRKPTGVTAMLSPGTFGHGGAFGTQYWMDPEKDLFVILLIQRVGLPNSDASKMRQTLQELAAEGVKK
jgi:CubicO group peptidase (beta-lactamase class C family)